MNVVEGERGGGGEEGEEGEGGRGRGRERGRVNENIICTLYLVRGAFYPRH